MFECPHHGQFCYITSLVDSDWRWKRCMVRPDFTNLSVARYALVNDKDYATRRHVPALDCIVNVQSKAPQSPTQKADQMILHAAIHSATFCRLRQTLKEICAENPQAFEAACDKLLVDERANGSSKRKRPGPNAQHRFEICVQCESAYDVTDNSDTACIWHPGTYIRACRDIQRLG
ncbi:hypothetical protein BDU57DRAFT_50909 [Ampelomyces quisqualis]|uniref:Uncharacterized protein n=1 Tax=Ampelomyces quisqualis TaxID=50730 RepID=A0A6A5R3B0_AMPQU|nr:hypothetical protein BDU57DRAFT_50909 [Ampelomyces quisqualis]